MSASDAESVLQLIACETPYTIGTVEIQSEGGKVKEFLSDLHCGTVQHRTQQFDSSAFMVELRFNLV